jgi:hypothetical protein
MSRSYPQALTWCVALIALPLMASAQVSINISVTSAPPELPVYVQPPMPDEGYLWTPGYWGWDPDYGYYWVPGTWVQPPQPGFLWTPGYWGADNGAFVFHAGYWGEHIGFYGGVDYGFGYVGNGFEGAYWRGGNLYYNRTVNNLGNVHVTNVYSKAVVNNVTVNHISYNGGSGGIQASPTAAQRAAANERHIEATAQQTQHMQSARNEPALRASVNHGRPAIAATARAGQFNGPGVVAAHLVAGKAVHSASAPHDRGGTPVRESVIRDSTHISQPPARPEGAGPRVGESFRTGAGAGEPSREPPHGATPPARAPERAVETRPEPKAAPRSERPPSRAEPHEETR